MSVIKLKPEKEQRNLWIISWIVSLITGSLVWIVLSVTVDLFIFLMAALGWLVIMVPIIIWIPAAFRALEYYIDDEGVKMKGGVIWKKHVTVPYPKITNVDVTQGPLQRKYNIGTIHIQTAGSGGKQGEKAELRMQGIRELERIRKLIIGRIKDPSYHLSSVIRKEEESIQSENISVFKDMLEELEEIKSLLKRNQR
jgi:membrane protein YdbS with pleckstrin-like domain